MGGPVTYESDSTGILGVSVTAGVARVSVGVDVFGAIREASE
jgi:hypothetical protein